MDQKRLDEIRARVEAAPGLWIDKECTSQADGCWCRWIDGPPHTGEKTVCNEGCLYKEDAIFIAHARQDVPALLAEIERLRDAARESAIICRFQQKRWYEETCDDKAYASWSRWTEYFEAIAAGRDVKSPCRVPH